MKGARPGRPARRWSPPVTALHLTAAAAALAGLALFAGLVNQPRVRSAGPGEDIVLGALSVAVEKAAWVAHDMSEMGGMPMGAPGDTPAEGTSRLHVQLSLANAGNVTQVTLDDFRLQAGSGRSWNVERATIAAVTTVPADGGLVGDLYFEVPDGERALRLAVDRGRSRALLALPLPGSAAMPADDGHDRTGK